MNRFLRNVLVWLPRVLAILFALFLGMFAMDVFGEHLGVGKTVLALLIHLVPTCLVLIALAVAWRWEAAGAVLFIAFGLCCTAIAIHRLSWIVVIAGPAFVIAALFLVDWFHRKRLIAT